MRTRDLTKLDDVIGVLRGVAPHEVASFATSLLQHPIDWARLALEFLCKVDDNRFVEMVLKEHIKLVEPRIFMLHDEPAHFQIIIHHFDRLAFDEHWKAGRLGTHYHHFSFATRILKGAYHHWLFDNTGTLDSPNLSASYMAQNVAGDVYLMPWDRFHCVMAPEDDSLSFMIRGPAVTNPGHEPDPNYTSASILSAKEMLIRSLTEVPSASPGRLADFSPIPISI